MISGPWSLYAPSFERRAIDFKRMRSQLLAIGDTVLTLDQIPSEQIAGDYPCSASSGPRERPLAHRRRTCRSSRPAPVSEVSVIERTQMVAAAIVAGAGAGQRRGGPGGCGDQPATTAEARARRQRLHPQGRARQLGRHGRRRLVRVRAGRAAPEEGAARDRHARLLRVLGLRPMYAFIRHTVRKGSIVIYPRWQTAIATPCPGPFDIEPCIASAVNGIGGALAYLRSSRSGCSRNCARRATSGSPSAASSPRTWSIDTGRSACRSPGDLPRRPPRRRPRRAGRAGARRLARRAFRRARWSSAIRAPTA